MSFRFTDLIRRDMIVRDIRNCYPETEAVFERFRVRASCWDCSVDQVAHRSSASVDELLGALNDAIAPRIMPESKG